MPRPKKKFQIVPPAIQPSPVVVPQFLNIAQAAVYLSATVTSTRRWLKAQKLRSAKVGRRFIYARSDIDKAWLRVATKGGAGK